MPSSRIFVSYVCLGDEPGARIGKQLLSDIRATNTEAVSDHETISDEHFMPFLRRELPQCGCLLVVQTPAALQSWRVQNAVTLARMLTAQQQMQMMRVIAAPSPAANEQSPWAALPTFDASIDYPRMREKIFLALGLTEFDAGDSSIIELPFLPGPGLPEPASGYLPSQPPGSMFGAGESRWPMPPPAPASQPVGSDWSTPPFARPPQPVGTTRPVQQSGSIAASGRTQWPLQPSIPVSPLGRTSDAATPAHPSRSSAVQALFTRLWKLSQTSIAALPGLPLREAHETVTLRSDHPQLLDTTRQRGIRRAMAIGMLLILILAVTLIVVLVHNHLSG